MTQNLNGWLKPNGEFADLSEERHCAYCDDEMSDQCNYNILKCKMFNSGYIKLSEGKWYCLKPDMITENQSLYIIYYCEQRNEEVPKFLLNITGKL